jgi:hypothetical protein
MSATYSYEQLKAMRGQAVKDVWHSMIGKPPGIKNTTGLKNGEEIIQAILEGQRNPEYLKTFGVRPPKQEKQEETKEMPPKQKEKKKPGPKPKEKTAPILVVAQQKQTLAYESNVMPLVPQEVKRIAVRKLFVGEAQYFVETKTNKLFTIVDGRPGCVCGSWNPQSRQVSLE